MSESIFEKSTQGKLSEVFGSMTQSPAPKVEAKRAFVEESAPVQESAPVSRRVGTRFDEVFQTIISEESDIAVDFEGVVDGEPVEGEYDEYDENEMVSVPKAILKELLAYMEDTMGPEDSADLEIPMEGCEYSLARNHMGNTTKVGSDKQPNKVGTSSTKTSTPADKNSARTGKVEFLKNLLTSYLAMGSSKQPNKLGVNDQTVNK